MQVVVALELFGVASGLQGRHHELVVVRDLLLLALLLLEFSNFVLDVIELDVETLFPVTHLGAWSLTRFLNDSLRFDVVVITDLLTQLLND